MQFISYLKLTVVFIFFSFAVLACSQAAPPSSRRAGIVVAESKSYEASLYRQNCAICHGVEGNGKELNGKQIPSLRFGDIEKRTEEELYHQIAVGKLPMPGFKNQLSEEEIRRMVVFIRRDLQGKE